MTANRTLPIYSKSLISTTFELSRAKSKSAPKVHCNELKQSKKGRNINECIRNFP